MIAVTIALRAMRVFSEIVKDAVFAQPGAQVAIVISSPTQFIMS